MEAAGIFERVSSGGQDEANQHPDLVRHCTSHDYEIARRYEVHGKSASKGEHQPDLDRMLDDIRHGVITVLVIWHSDRIERRPGKALLDLLAEISAAGGRVESVQEPMLGQLDFGSQVTTFIAGLVNAEKSAHLKQQVRAAHDHSRANGAFIGKPPWGYTTVGSKYNRALTPTDEGREYVPQIYARVIEGQSLAVIARWLESGGVAPVGIAKERKDGRGKSGQWWPRTIGEMIRNPVYMGRRCEWDVKSRRYGKTTHECPSLVDAATFQRANKSLDARPKRGATDPNSRAMLSGVLSCGQCPDSPMYRITTKDGQYYRCSGRGAARKGCGCMVPIMKVDAACSEIISIWFNSEIQERTLVPGNEAELDAQLEEIRYDIRQLGDRDLDDDKYDQELARLRQARKTVESAERTLDRWESTGTGQRYADVYDALSPADRGVWLKGEGFTVTATKTEVAVNGTQPDAGVIRVTRFALAI